VFWDHIALADFPGLILNSASPITSQRSVVVASLKKVDPVVRDVIYKPMLLSDSPRPATFKHVAKRLRLSYTLKRIAHNCLDQIKDPEGSVAIGFDPVP
jgi:hypothetical protein